MRLPARSYPNKKLKFNKKNRWGYDLKVAIRENAKTIDLYHIPIEIDPYVTGRTDDGKEIPINTLGRWLFGTPGYKGHIVAYGGEEYITISFPEYPPEALDLIKKAIDML